VAADDGKPGVDVQVLTALPGSVTTLDATSVTTGWGPSWPMMMPQTPVIVVTVDKKADGKGKDAKGYSEVFKRV